ncbi:MAG: hypothetical protein WC217_02060 [Candidatus Paceibacterota bacterium]|jgi:hypothetical protein
MLRTIFWSFIFFLTLSFFGISIQAIVNSPAGQANIAYIASLFSQLWLFILSVWQWATDWIHALA